MKRSKLELSIFASHILFEMLQLFRRKSADIFPMLVANFENRDKPDNVTVKPGQVVKR